MRVAPASLVAAASVRTTSRQPEEHANAQAAARWPARTAGAAPGPSTAARRPEPNVWVLGHTTTFGRGCVPPAPTLKGQAGIPLGQELVAGAGPMRPAP